MPPAPNLLPTSVLARTAVDAAGGGILLALDADRSRAGHGDAYVLHDGEILHVRLDGLLGVAAVRPAGRMPLAACA